MKCANYQSMQVEEKSAAIMSGLCADFDDNHPMYLLDRPGPAKLQLTTFGEDDGQVRKNSKTFLCPHVLRSMCNLFCSLHSSGN